MGTTSQVGGTPEEEEAPPKRRKLELGQRLLKQYVASVFESWARVRLGLKLGPGLGLITERLHDLDLSTALPRQLPSRGLIDGAAAAFAYDSAPTERLRNANVWAAALETHLERVPEIRRPPGEVLTTYGFVRIQKEIRLAVIHYLRPRAAFTAVPQQPIEIMGWRFPVIIRPWLPTEHSGFSRLDGNCWVKFLDEAGERQPGILTARHALKPKNATPPNWVRFDVSRLVPRGRLHYTSTKMDAAVVAVEDRQWRGRVRSPHSTVVGYKPVRLITGHGTVDADIVEHSGFTAATIPGQPGQEPLNGAYMILHKHLEPGDSGCLVLDLESAQRGWLPPYLIYLGETNLKLGGRAGYGLLIEQANKVWDLECYMDENP